MLELLDGGWRRRLKKPILRYGEFPQLSGKGQAQRLIWRFFSVIEELADVFCKAEVVIATVGPRWGSGRRRGAPWHTCPASLVHYEMFKCRFYQHTLCSKMTFHMLPYNAIQPFDWKYHQNALDARMNCSRFVFSKRKILVLSCDLPPDVHLSPVTWSEAAGSSFHIILPQNSNLILIVLDAIKRWGLFFCKSAGGRGATV